jgi:hypothetical protein
MFAADLEAESVARKIERANLPAAIIEDLGGSHGAADELVKILRRLILPINLGIASK